MTQEVKQRRLQSNYQPENARFLLDCDFSKQYDLYYRKRLEKTRPYLEYNCRSKWDPNIPIYDLSEVATFSATSEELNLDAEATLFQSPNNPNEELFCNYHFKKRLRKHSQSEGGTPEAPQTSTQNQRQDGEDDEFLFSDDDLEFTSPIMGAQKVAGQASVSPSVRKPKGSQTAKCIVMGTIFKRMKLQPDVVEELSKGDFHVKCERYLGHYASQGDTLVLEDTEESIQLVGNINPKRFVTGVVVGLLGVSIDDGSQFMVFDICFAEPNRELLYDYEQLLALSNPPERPLNVYGPCYLLIVSDLGFHHEMDKNVELTRALQDMINFVWGGAKFADDSRSSRVTRILVAGNSLHEDRFTEDEDELVSRAIALGRDEIMFKMKQSRQVKQYTKTIRAAAFMDEFFAQLSKTIHVDVMPGASDPSSHLMPQQPFHPCMFPQSSCFSTFNSTTNPHHAIYNHNVEILATAGQNVDIISKFSGLREPMDIMKCHLMWGNSAPSAPDNLYSVPYEDEDPFVIDFIPDVYVAGCQDEYNVECYRYTASDSRITSQSSGDTSFLGAERQSDPSRMSSDAAAGSTSHGLFDTPKLARVTPVQASQKSRESVKSPPTPLGSNDASARKTRTLLVTVPKFRETLSCVLLDLVSLESHLLSFK